MILITAAAVASSAQREPTAAYTYVRSDGRDACIKLAETDSTTNIEYWVGGQMLSQWPILHRVFRMECGDINGDDIPEIAVGVVKATRYSQVEAKRLFLFKLFEEELIRPLWLGSRVAHHLEDFTIEPTGTILTQEEKLDGSSVSVRYKLGGFGLKFVEYVEN